MIGLNLAGIPIKNMAASNFDSWMQVVTFVSVGLVAVLTRGMVQRLLILVGLIVASIIYAVLTNGLGLGKPLDLSAVLAAPWVGMPGFSAPVFSGPAMLLIAPVAIILVAENLEPHQGRDGHDRQEPGPVHGPRVHWRRHCHHGQRRRKRHWGYDLCREHRRDGGHQDLFDRRVPGGGAHCRGAGIQPQVWRRDPGDSAAGDGRCVHRGFGLIAVAGAKIWVDNKVDFSQNKNLIVAAITLILGTGDFTLKFGQFALGGIGTATFGAIVLYALLNRKS